MVVIPAMMHGLEKVALKTKQNKKKQEAGLDAKIFTGETKMHRIRNEYM